MSTLVTVNIIAPLIIAAGLFLICKYLVPANVEEYWVRHPRLALLAVGGPIMIGRLVTEVCLRTPLIMVIYFVGTDFFWIIFGVGVIMGEANVVLAWYRRKNCSTNTAPQKEQSLVSMVFAGLIFNLLFGYLALTTNQIWWGVLITCGTCVPLLVVISRRLKRMRTQQELENAIRGSVKLNLKV